MRVLPMLALIAALFPFDGASQTGGSLPRVLDLPASARAMALGDAYMVDAGQSDAIFYHPDLLTGGTGFGIEYQRWGSESSSVAASAVPQWFGAGVGIGLLTLQYGAPGIGPAVAPPGQDHLFDLGPTPVSERIAVLAATLREFPHHRETLIGLGTYRHQLGVLDYRSTGAARLFDGGGAQFSGGLET